jgi:soluble lytic murein transglycosylase-like protein
VLRQVGAQNSPSSFFTTPWVTGSFTSANTRSADGSTTTQMTASADCDPIPRANLDAMIEAAAQRQSLDPKVVRAVVDQESGGRPCAVSPKGAQGLMQLMPSVAADFQVADPFNPEQNLDAGTKLLKQLLVRYDGDLSKALSAYNAGSARVDKSGGIPGIPETIRYVSAIMGALLH